MSVLRIAFSVGFGSSEAFAHAFKAHFGVSPSAWRREQRKNRNPDQVIRNGDQEGGIGERYSLVSQPRSKEIKMHVTLIDRPPTTVACMRNVGPYGEPILEFWQKVVVPWMVTNDLFGKPRYGISHDDPGITAPEKCRPFLEYYELDATFDPETGVFSCALCIPVSAEV